MDMHYQFPRFSNSVEDKVTAMLGVLKSPEYVSEKQLLAACEYILRYSRHTIEFETARLLKEALVSRSDAQVNARNQILGLDVDTELARLLDFCNNSLESSTREADTLECTLPASL